MITEKTIKSDLVESESKFQKILDNLGFGFTVNIQVYSFFDEDDYRYRFIMYPDRIEIEDTESGRIIVLDEREFDSMDPKDRIPAKQIFNLILNISRKRFCEGSER